MKLTGDFHTHTIYTHGTSTIAENVAQAENLGLKAIAITEHAYKSRYPMKVGDLDKMREEISQIKDNYSTKILLGVETNLISKNGDVDVPDDELNKLDLVVLGFHCMSKVSVKEFLIFVLPNLLVNKHLKKPSKKQIERNTSAYLQAIEKHRVSIIAHLQYGGCVVDCEKIARVCAEKGIYIELNGKRINLSQSDIDKMVTTGVKFIINSDAHDKFSVGKNHRAFNLIEKYKIPIEQIANIDKMPKFK